MEYDYSKLRGKIKEKFGTQINFAKAMGMTEPTLSLKLNNKGEWSQEEMTLALDLLGESLAVVDSYFFTHKDVARRLLEVDI
ncbi:MAG: DUF739 family protein [Christensenellales bacterium]